MIFITVGTQKFQFNRLLKAIDKLIEKKIINDRVICQSGFSTYIPKNYQTVKFMPQNEYNYYICNCDLLITHAGVGSILEAKKYNKPVIAIPRLKKFEEHVDDHQQQIVSGFAKKKIVFESNCSNLEEVLHRVKYEHLQKYNFNNEKFVQKIESIFKNIQK